MTTKTLGLVFLLAPLVVGIVSALAEAWGHDRRLALFVTVALVSMAVGGILVALAS